jgi:hypothetical protein
MIVRQVSHLQELYWAARSAEHKFLFVFAFLYRNPNDQAVNPVTALLSTCRKTALIS